MQAQASTTRRFRLVFKDNCFVCSQSFGPMNKYLPTETWSDQGTSFLVHPKLWYLWCLGRAATPCTHDTFLWLCCWWSVGLLGVQIGEDPLGPLTRRETRSFGSISFRFPQVVCIHRCDNLYISVLCGYVYIYMHTVYIRTVYIFTHSALSWYIYLVYRLCFSWGTHKYGTSKRRGTSSNHPLSRSPKKVLTAWGHQTKPLSQSCTTCFLLKWSAETRLQICPQQNIFRKQVATDGHLWI